MKVSALTLALGASVVHGHSIMQSFNGLAQGRGIYMPTYDGPIEDVTSQSLACNGSPNYGFRSPTEVIPIKAGQEVTGTWLHTLTSTGADSTADNKVIDSSHKGPFLVYMKKVSNALDNPKAGPGDGWFKIKHEGYQTGTRWAVDDLIANGGVQKAVIPTCITDGDYLLRFELIALHSAHNIGGAQLYESCVSVRVSGGTNKTTPATVSIPGIYKATDPGIHFSVWTGSKARYPNTPYPIPGPEVLNC